MKLLHPIELSRKRRSELDEPVSSMEKNSYRAVAGTLMYLVNSIILHAAAATSPMQQRLFNLRVKHIVYRNRILEDIKKMTPTIRFRRPSVV